MVLFLVAAVSLLFAVFLGALLLQRRVERVDWRSIPDSILSNGASAKKLEQFGDVDYVVIGSGLSGLATAAFLSRRGHRVLVLEQHDVAGGATHSFNEKGFEWDTGVHYVGGRLDERFSLIGRLFDAVTNKSLEWCQCDEVYDSAINTKTGERVEMGRSRKENLENIRNKFGDDFDCDKYDRLSDLAVSIAVATFALKALPRWIARRIPLPRWAWDKSLAQVLNECCRPDNHAAKGALAYLYGDYGVPPAQSPFAIHALVDKHYDGGAYFPRGGSKSIAKCILATHPNVACLVRARVTSISGKVVTCKGVEVKARRGVISSAGVVNTRALAGLPPPEFSTPSVGLVYAFVGLDAPAKDLDVPASNAWLHAGWRHDDNWAKFREPGDEPPVAFVSSVKDDAQVDKKATVQVLVPVKYEWFEKWENDKVKHRGQEYVELKEAFQQKLLEKMYQAFPKTRGRVEHCSIASPLTANFYFNANRGATYGLEHSIPRFSKHHAFNHLHTEVQPGLYLVGQDHLCCGVATALLSGLVTTIYLDKIAALLALVDALSYLFGSSRDTSRAAMCTVPTVNSST